MKKILLSICACAFFLIGFTVDADAQRSNRSSRSASTSSGDSEGGGMAIRTNPITLAISLYNVSLEKSFGKTSVIVGANYFNGFGDDGLVGFGTDISYRLYLTGGDMEGFYVNPKFGFSGGNDLFDDSFIGIKLAVELGYQIRTDGGFIFDIGVGPAWRKYTGDTTSELGSRWPSGTLAMGYAF